MCVFVWFVTDVRLTKHEVERSGGLKQSETGLLSSATHLHTQTDFPQLNGSLRRDFSFFFSCAGK